MSVGPSFRWTEFELAQLRRMAADRRNSFQIARALGNRSPSAVRIRAHMLGIKLAKPNMGQVPRDPDLSTWTAADRISEWAQVPQALAELLIERSTEAGHNLKELRSDTRRPPFVHFRKSFSTEAHRLGFSFSAIGRALNRDHTTIIHAVRSTESAFFCGKTKALNSSADAVESKIAA